MNGKVARFVRIKLTVSLSDCGESFEYSEVNSDPTIVFHGAPSLDEVYVWNGKAYEFSQYTGMTSFELWKSGKSGFSYEVEAEMSKNALASGDMENFGPGYPDYLRFRLGVDYAFLSKPKEAIDVFQELHSSPFDKSRYISEDGQNFYK